MQLLLVVALVFASFVALFALQNAQTVSIRFFSWAAETSVAVVALASAALGAVGAVLAGFLRRVAIGIQLRQVKAELARAERRASELEKEKSELEKARSEWEKERSELERRLRLAEERAALPVAQPPEDGEEAGGKGDGQAQP